MISSRLNKYFDAFRKLTWALFLIFLPVTSFPYFPPTIGGSALVRPLSLYPLIILIILVTIPYFFKKPIYPTLLTLAPLILVVILSSLISFLQGIQPSQGISITERTFRALITLAVGIGVYLTVTFFPRSREDLQSSLRWLYVGFSIALTWGALQIIYIAHFNRLYFRWLNKIQQHISIRRLFTNRVSGLTYEPNWFAEQITLLLLPWLLASVITGQSVFRWRWRWLSIEFFLLVWAIFVLLFTFSRTGLIILAILILVSVLFLRPLPVKTLLGSRISLNRPVRRLLEAGLLLLTLTIFIFIAGQNNDFFSRIWSYWSEKKSTSLSGYFEYLGFGARFSYGETALNIFVDNPTFGVGLGNYAFYFNEYLPDEPLAPVPEILRLVTPESGRDRLVTPKNFYLRLLSETGLIGLAAFLVFLFAILGCAIFLWRNPARRSDARFWGTAGILGVISFSMAAFTFDSFAIPNMWVVFGLITASTWVIYQSQKSKLELTEVAKSEIAQEADTD